MAAKKKPVASKEKKDDAIDLTLDDIEVKRLGDDDPFEPRDTMPLVRSLPPISEDLDAPPFDAMAPVEPVEPVAPIDAVEPPVDIPPAHLGESFPPTLPPGELPAPETYGDEVIALSKRAYDVMVPRMAEGATFPPFADLDAQTQSAYHEITKTVTNGGEPNTTFGKCVLEVSNA